MHFKDRQDAGKQLAHALRSYKDKDAVIFALPRGGVVIGGEIAKFLNAPLDLIIPRKIGHPDNPEYAIAAVGESGDVVQSGDSFGHIDQEWFKKEVNNQLEEIKRRRKLYLGKKLPLDLKGKIAIIVDDGLATGLTMKVAIKELRRRKPKEVVVAVPVAPADTVKEIGKLVDDVVVLYVPSGFFGAIGSYYQDFDQVSDEEVIALLNR